MKRTIMSYMVATILSIAAIGGVAMQPIPSMAQTQGNESVPSMAQTQGNQPVVSTPTCGEVVQGIVNLTSNLNCNGDGLIVGGDNTIIHLNGYSIKGPGQESSKVGLMIPNNDNVVVEGPGDISNFQAGILVTGASHVKMSSLILEKNQIGMFMTGSDNAQVEQNIIKDNNLGIASHSSKSGIYTSNLLNGNVLAGITFVNTKDSTVSQNNIDGSQNGVFADAQSSGNTISMNNVLHNVIDLNNANGLPTNINSNSARDNNCQVSNPSGLCIGR
jgi:parallel beta-helix repeat protein